MSTLLKSIMKNIIVVVILIVATGCSEKENETISDFRYPLSVGNYWDYEIIYHLDYDSTANAKGLKDTLGRGYLNTQIVSNEIIFDSIDVYNFKNVDRLYNNIVFIDNDFINEKEDSLICYGHSSSNNKTLRQLNILKKNKVIFNGIRFNDIIEVFDYIKAKTNKISKSKNDTIYYSIFKEYEYPLEEGKEWLYNKGYFYSTNKKILNSEIVTVPAGKFNCWKIEHIDSELYMADEKEFYDYVSEDGLVRRYIKVVNMTVVDQTGSILGSVTTTQDQKLIEYYVE